ncbi:MAG: hypothetical protein JWM10_3719 [Myxococcaceae bacterium]|nr:hypothetical protein [Myxococcaceae bacterium]
MKESALQKAVRLALSGAGIVAFRNNVGTAEFWNEGRDDVDRVAYGIGGPGGSDLIMLVPLPSGIARFGALELKAPRARTKPARAALQEQFRRLVRGAGGFACVVRTVEEALAAVARAREGASE